MFSMQDRYFLISIYIYNYICWYIFKKFLFVKTFNKMQIFHLVTHHLFNEFAYYIRKYEEAIYTNTVIYFVSVYDCIFYPDLLDKALQDFAMQKTKAYFFGVYVDVLLLIMFTLVFVNLK